MYGKMKQEVINLILNITNGDAFNEYFLNTHPGEKAIAFREAMMQGRAEKKIFDENFILLRSAELGVSPDEYAEKMSDIISLGNKQNEYSEICLWFGRDTFCQLNLLTLLAFLEQTEYQGDIGLILVDDENFLQLSALNHVTTGIYGNLYRRILIDRDAGIAGCDTGVIDRKAIMLYFDYLSDDGRLARFIRSQPQEKGEDELVRLLLKESYDYGLSDIQARNLIKGIRKG